jgi:hypothetical protein
MVTVKPTLTLDLENGQRITMDTNEAKTIVRILGRLIKKEDGLNRNGKKIRRKRGNRNNAKISDINKYQKKIPSMSESKLQEILRNVDKHLSDTPVTLSGLLKGVSYSPNNLPAIRQVVEDQSNVAKQRIGKRTYYLERSNGRKPRRSAKSFFKR